MLRLWPEQLSLGLLGGAAWVQSGSSRRVLATEGGPLTRQIAGLAEQLLPAPGQARGWRPRIDVLLSDDAARLLVLPWQSNLRSDEQRRRYAEVCLESEGVGGDEWVVDAAYRQFGAAGLALAVRRDALADLAALAAVRHMALRRVLPVTAAAYWRYRVTSRERELLLLDEGTRFTALSYKHLALENIDVQLVDEDRELALRRLLRRRAAAQPGGRRAAYWSGAVSPLSSAALSALLPGTALRLLPPGAWR